MNVNEGFAATFGSLDAPMGGMKNSGLGRRQGQDGIRRFVEVQSVGTQSGLPFAPSHGLSAEVLHHGADRRDAGAESAPGRALTRRTGLSAGRPRLGASGPATSRGALPMSHRRTTTWSW